jgi:flavorubredoxin
MVKVFVIYDTKFGNTKLVAETIVEGMREVEGIETAISDVEEVDLERVADYDSILIGSPNHVGGPVRGIKKLIDELVKLDLKAKWSAIFDTYMWGRDFEKAVKKIEKRLNEKIPELKLIVPGLSIKVEGIKGPVVEGELAKCKEFGKQIANQLKTG